MARLHVSPAENDNLSGTREDSVSSRDEDAYLCRELRGYLRYRSRNKNPPACLVKVWEDFYQLYTVRVGTFLRRYGLPAADREDCLQDVWREFVSQLGDARYDPARGRLSTWLMTIARNRAVDAIRRRRHHSPGSLEEGRTLADTSPGPAAACERRSTQDRVRSILSDLAAQVSPVSFQVLYLRLIEDRTGAEVAEALGLTPEEVRFRLYRMKRRFRALFERSSALHLDDDAGVPPENGREKKPGAQRSGPSCEQYLFEHSGSDPTPRRKRPVPGEGR